MDLTPLKQAAQSSIKQNSADLAPVISTAIARGVHTSEFKMAAAGFGVAVLTGIGTALTAIPGPWTIIGAGILGGMSILGYTISRGLAKSNAVPASILASVEDKQNATTLDRLVENRTE